MNPFAQASCLNRPRQRTSDQDLSYFCRKWETLPQNEAKGIGTFFDYLYYSTGNQTSEAL